MKNRYFRKNKKFLSLHPDKNQGFSTISDIQYLFNVHTMKVLKFGGTSVGSAERIKEVAKLICDGQQKIVVLSAMSGTTNSLVEISSYLYKKNSDGASEVINALEKKYEAVVSELFSTEKYKQEGNAMIKKHFGILRSYSAEDFGEKQEKEVLAEGEMISTALMHFYLLETGKKSALMAALNFMRIDEDLEPDMDFIKEHIAVELKQYVDAELIITQGFICKNIDGDTDNLQRGGSDYTASLIGAAIMAEEIQIWTDIDGMHNNDPRFVENTKPIAVLSFEEAAELAYFGAKILHPTSVLPAKLAQVPVKLLNTMDPSAVGTTICAESEPNKIKAVAAKDGITAIKIKSGRMLLAHGFLRKVFEIFETYKTPIDVITTSEVGVSVTIDKDKHLEQIVNDLNELGTVSYDTDQIIICVAGDFRTNNTGFVNQITNALKNIPVRMVSYGGSSYNVSVVIDAVNKKAALNALSEHLF